MASAGAVKLFLHPHSVRYDKIIKITIKAETELLVGGGSLEQALSPFDIPVAKMPYGDKLIPYIPGSTLKGLVRTAAEEALREYARQQAAKSLKEIWQKIRFEGGRWREEHEEYVEKAVFKLLDQFVEITKKSARDLLNTEGETLYDKVKKYYNEYADIDAVLERTTITPYACYTTVEGLACELPLREYKKIHLDALREALNQEFPYPCPVCLTFGAPGYASNVVITDAYPAGELGKDYMVLTRRHVAIDRLTGAAAEGKLFTVEYVTAGAEFVGYILVKNANKCSDNINLEEELQRWKSGNGDCVHYAVLQEALKQLKHASLGRRKSTGMGLVTIDYSPAEDTCDKYPTPLKDLCNALR